MSLPKPNPVIALFAQGKAAIGTWITLCPHPRVAKIIAACGYDFVIIEMEHTDFDLQTVGTLAMLAREAGVVPVVRPPGTTKPHDLTRALDAGAMGLVLPNVESAEEAEKILRAVKYHPRGSRSLNTKGPHTDYVAAPAEQVIGHLNANTLTVAMIETRVGIGNLAEMCGVDGIDAFMIGPDDLSQDLGVPGRMDAPEMVAAIDEIFTVCHTHGKPVGLTCHSVEMGENWLSKGAKWLPYSNDAAMVLNAGRAAVPQLMARAGRSGA